MCRKMWAEQFGMIDSCMFYVFSAAVFVNVLLVVVAMFASCCLQDLSLVMFFFFRFVRLYWTVSIIILILWRLCLRCYYVTAIFVHRRVLGLRNFVVWRVYRALIYTQSAVLPWQVVCPSVCPRQIGIGRQNFLIGTPRVLTSVLLIQWIQVLFRYGSLCGRPLGTYFSM